MRYLKAIVAGTKVGRKRSEGEEKGRTKEGREKERREEKGEETKARGKGRLVRGWVHGTRCGGRDEKESVAKIRVLSKGETRRGCCKGER